MTTMRRRRMTMMMITRYMMMTMTMRTTMMMMIVMSGLYHSTDDVPRLEEEVGVALTVSPDMTSKPLKSRYESWSCRC